MRPNLRHIAVSAGMLLAGASLWADAAATAPLPIFNVRDYGARGNGIADDYTALKLAIAALNATGTGTLYLPPGTYRIDRYKGDPMDPGVTDLTVQGCSDVTVSGYGATLDIKGDFVRDSDYRNSVQLAFSRCRRLTVQGLTLDGNVDRMTRYPADRGEGACSGIATSACSDYTIRDVAVHHFANDGIYLGGSATTADRNATLLNVRCSSNARQGLSIIQLRGGRFDGCVFEGTGLTDAAGGAVGQYGLHRPTAGVDVEPVDGPPDIDALTGDLVFRNCTFRNNQGPQFQAGQHSLTENVALWDCRVQKGSSPNPDTVVMVVPGGLIASCDLDVDNVFVTRWDFQVTARTVVWNCRIRSDKWGISDASLVGTGIIEGNEITGTQTAPLTVPFVNLGNPHTVFRNNRVFLPAAALAGGATAASRIRNVSLSAGNAFRTDAAGPGYFYTDYGGTPVVDDLFPSGAIYRPGLDSSWDTGTPYSQGQAAPGLPPAIGDLDGDGQVAMPDVAVLLAVAAGLRPAGSIAVQSWFPNTALELTDAIRLARYVEWLNDR